MNRAGSDIDRNGLKTATKQLMRDLGGVDAASTCTRVVRSKLHEYGDLARPDRFMPIDVALDLERVAGSAPVLAALARLQGFTLVPLQMRGEGDLAAALQRVATDAGTTLGDAMLALTHGMPADDVAKLMADLGELHAATGDAMAMLRARQPGHGATGGLAIVKTA